MSFKIILLFALIALTFGQDYDDGGYDGGEGGYDGGDGGDGGYDGGDGGEGGYDSGYGGEAEGEGGYAPNGGAYGGGEYTPGAEYQTQNLYSGFAPSLTAGLGYLYSPMAAAASNTQAKVAPSRRTENMRSMKRSGHNKAMGPVMTYVKTDLTGNFKWGIKHLVNLAN